MDEWSASSWAPSDVVVALRRRTLVDLLRSMSGRADGGRKAEMRAILAVMTLMMLA